MMPVLLVDPDPVIRQRLRQALEARWHPVFEAADERAALDLLVRCIDPLVVLLSSRTRPVDGMQLLQAVATDPSLRERHGYLVLSKEAGWLPPSFRLLEETLNLRHLTPLRDLPALLDTVTAMSERLPGPARTLPPRR
jgi:CheY-like chemotaxis protein